MSQARIHDPARRSAAVASTGAGLRAPLAGWLPLLGKDSSPTLFHVEQVPTERLCGSFSAWGTRVIMFHLEHPPSERP
jgi:hypothetical protein